MHSLRSSYPAAGCAPPPKPLLAPHRPATTIPPALSTCSPLGATAPPPLPMAAGCGEEFLLCRLHREQAVSPSEHSADVAAFEHAHSASDGRSAQKARAQW